MRMISIFISVLLVSIVPLAAAQDQAPKQMRAKFTGLVYDIQGGPLDGKLGYVFSLRSRQQVPVQLTALPGRIDMDVQAVLSAGGIHTNGQPSFVGRTQLGEVMFDGTSETLNAVPKPRRGNRPGNVIIVVDNVVRRLEWDFGDKKSRALLRHGRVEPLDLSTPGGPTTLGYPDYIPMLYGEETAPITPEFSTAFRGFTVTPELPGNLELDPETGVISGIAPDENYFQSYHTVTAQGVSQRISIYTTISLAEIDINPLPEYWLTVSGFDPYGFNPQSIEFGIDLGGDGAFSQHRSVYDPPLLTLNDSEIRRETVDISANRVETSLTLEDGANEVIFRYFDHVGRAIYVNETIWAGANDLVINLRDEHGAFYTTEPADITVRSVDNREIMATQPAEFGQATFTNIPTRTLMVHVVTESGLRGFGGAYGGDGTVDIIIRPDGPISEIDNNDFSLGLEGWIASDPDSISLVPHDETRGPDEDENTLEDQDEGALQISPQAWPQGSRRAKARRAALHRQQEMASADLDLRTQQLTPDDDPVNRDLRLQTSGEGEKSVARNFLTRIGTTRLTIRYRFITSEIPGEYYGSPYNDTYSVSIKVPQAGLDISEQSSMNDLSYEAFDEITGATEWTYVSLVGDLSEIRVYAGASVSNVWDELLDSVVEIDFIEEFSDAVSPALAWTETDGGLNLTYDIHGTAPPPSEIGIHVFFADGDDRADILGLPIHESAATYGSDPGAYGPDHILGAFLSDAPDAATHIIAVAGQNEAVIEDVSIGYAWNVDSATVSAGMKDVIKDGLRQAGTPTARITSSVRDPETQAEAMFENLARGNNIAANIQRQLAIYFAPGDAVIRAFQTAAQGFTPDQIRGEERVRIEAAMLDEIAVQGCPNVSRHCDDPEIISVVDIPHAYFTGGGNGSAATRFRAEVAPRLQTLLSENSVFHLEYIN